VKTPRWDAVDADAKEAFTELVQHLGARVEELDLAAAEDAFEWHRVIMDAEMAVNLRPEWDKGAAQLSPSLRARLERGREVRATDYLRAQSAIARLNEGFDDLFTQRYDAIITPAAAGTAPAGLESTGEPTFNTLWTLCGTPAITLPLMQGANGLPLGVQLVGREHADARLLRTARWLVEAVRA
jgi:Asp-tRNA(Asn)/Glu-tRNA(Gln) amidotransferase A subunit family amidase